MTIEELFRRECEELNAKNEAIRDELAAAQARVAELEGAFANFVDLAASDDLVDDWLEVEIANARDLLSQSPPTVREVKTRPVTAEMIHAAEKAWWLSPADLGQFQAFAAAHINAAICSPPKCPGCGADAVQVSEPVWGCGNRECAVMGVDS